MKPAQHDTKAMGLETGREETLAHGCEVSDGAHKKVSRRAFIKNSLVGTGAITFAIHLPSLVDVQTSSTSANGSLKPNAWVEIPLQGRIRFICGRTEMGQGTSTGLAMLLCEEMELSLQDIDLVMAPASRKYDHADYLLQTTGGSSSLRSEFTLMLQAGASVRELFKLAAAERWKVKAEEIRVTGGLFSHPRAPEPLKYADLVPQARGLSLPKAAIREPAQWRLVGKRVPRLDNLVKATGAPIYGIDAYPGDMLCAWVMHGPSMLSWPKSCNDKEVATMPGVLKGVFHLAWCRCDCAKVLVGKGGWREAAS
jgi:isoquinoline 1-oxidoreductase subunit beta